MNRITILAAALLALPATAAAGDSRASQLLLVQPAGSSGPLVAYDTASGNRRFLLPPGMASAAGKRYFAVTRGELDAFDPATGRRVRSYPLRGRWALQGVSPRGRWLALTRRAAAKTEVQILDADAGRTAHRLRLPGNFEVETVSAGGQRLFLIQHLRGLGGTRYHVRLYDLSREKLWASPLRAKGADEVMAGYAWSGLASPDGRWLLTLYLSTRRNAAFIHALNLANASPVCVFLPSGDGAFPKLKEYALALSPDGRYVYAANPRLGVVADVSLASYQVVRTARFRPAAGGSGHGSSALSANGRTLYFTSGRGLWAYDTAFGVVRGPYAASERVTGLGFSRDGRRVFAALADGPLLALDAATGKAA